MRHIWGQVVDKEKLVARKRVCTEIDGKIVDCLDTISQVLSTIRRRFTHLSHWHTCISQLVCPSRQTKTIDLDGILAKLIIFVDLPEISQVNVFEWTDGKSNMTSSDRSETGE